MHLRRSLAVAVAVVLASTAAACSSEDPAAEFAAAVTARDAQAAADLTSDPAAAKPALQAAFDGMGSAKPSVTAGRDGDSPALGWSWALPRGKKLEYSSPVQTSGGRVTWSPTLIHPDQPPGGRLLYSDEKSYRTPVLDRKNSPLMTWQTVTVVSLAADRSDSAENLAARLNPIDRSVTAASIRAAVANKTGAVDVISLRADDARRAGDLRSISGVTTREQGRLLTAAPALRSPLGNGLEERWRGAVDGAAGASVNLVDSSGKTLRHIESFPGTTPAPVRSTLDAGLQRAANAAVAGENRPTMLVAIRPSTGGILAVAQNAAADKQGPIALTGLYPPGSTFKTITTAAALDAGVTTPNAMLDCPGRATFGTRTIPNEDDFALGSVPLHTAFAKSCNTTMAGLGTKLGENALADTAKTFGLGVDFVILGITTVTGSVPSARTDAERVEESIGQGRVTASPFGLAVVEASLAARNTVRPSLFDGEPARADTPGRRIDAGVADALRAAMRETVTAGTATALRDIPGLGGKTGTAEFGDNTHAHGWFAGIVGDLAFATLVVSGESSGPAVSVSGAFLRGAGGDLP
ncbi:Penicillin-binding protein transpeptidase OS=Tsukamurella paurometabola (strain ATCC 8368 / DSM/ CCUG 35730 / CIP 100753 / JCM 10117 / KCTC 9821 / NBRC 16120 / NCIMB 702349 / NCTC 13040) OX=521096 GN=Tpau_3973 PE=3 SV=1 [Tsukamurella paurometabola]|uniref:Penicillin-binding protein transpeptidase n=1 Tax=Tsukamurella paurometabola (strain ATCC 8368 / DSM 20162 / CCUG 35730 / CIP 100753 / JCM 10117 / KCTC 9821 / NBRC 16120 / NCIMB 702349 / NCTC 13040) TaxID=521096 RepID=D5UMS0_TSUPD|nr:penicillin-binding transpeptidase domain-containing protein [Tsukamurella paurometabola]ADG80544.1 penicillin-binding protein transpeptidase [Tsukamurella paurometabola DSM 20162]SUP40037.1 Penicillin-binding protein A [Tsukamurella paurometabola]